MPDIALIVTPNYEFYSQCSIHFRAQNTGVHQSFPDRVDVRKAVEEIQPQILLVDDIPPENATDLIEVARDAVQNEPTVFVCTERRSSGDEARYLQHRVLYVLRRDMQMGDMVQSILSVHSIYLRERYNDEIHKALVNILRTCRISSKHRGYRALYDCVQLLYRFPDQGRSMTKVLYPNISRRHDTKPIRLEKNIRDSIHRAWDDGGDLIIPAYLSIVVTKEKPTNRQMLRALCNKLHEDLGKARRPY